MVIDTSALVAITLKEPSRAALLEVIEKAHAKVAISAFERFGKGMKHRAQLNFGDCAVYALAVLQGEPVLATGDDFRATDIALLRF